MRAALVVVLLCATAHAEDVVAEERREEIAQSAEVELRRAKAAAAQAGVTEPIVELSRFRFREHLVCLDDLGAVDEHAMSSSCELAQEFVDVALAADVHASGWLFQHQ